MRPDFIMLNRRLMSTPECVTLASRCSVTLVTACGALYVLWCAFEDHLPPDSDILRGVGLDYVDSLVAISGFGRALVEVGWLRETADGIEAVDYQKHNGPAAKARFLNARRAWAWRSRQPENAPRNARVTPTYDSVRKRNADAFPDTNTDTYRETPPNPPLQAQGGEPSARAPRPKRQSRAERDAAKRERMKAIEAKCDAVEKEVQEAKRERQRRNSQ